RDAAWMGKLYNWLGLSVGVVYPGMPHADKKAAYAADITYGTNNEFGFDYLRDNMALSKQDRFQRGLHYAIVDEVDSILIDEARTPLIISGPADESPELYIRGNRIVPQLKRQETEDAEGDYWVDEKGKQVHLSEAGMEHAEELLRRAGIISEGESAYGADSPPRHDIRVNPIVPQLKPPGTADAEGDYWVDEKGKQVHLSEAGMEHAEELLRRAGIISEGDSLYGANNLSVVHHLNAALRA